MAFGHRRLSVIDLSPHGAQPMVDNELGLTAVFNGCIYDYQELRAELEGHGYRFFSTSDTEVILKGYHQWGTDVVSHLHGMFAFVIHERDTGRVVMARDRLGIKPLYLAETPNRLRFASTLPALLRAGDVDTSIDPVALHHYLTWHAVVPAPRTMLTGVRKLPPATVRVIEADGTSTEHRYWQPRYERRPEHANWSARDWEDAVEEALRVAVRRRLVADIPVGVLLSGGLDSSLIVGLLAQEGQTGLATYSIGFESVAGREGDEFAYSDVIAERFGTDHHRIRVGSDELAGALGHAIGAMAEPMVSHDVVAFDLLSERVSADDQGRAVGPGRRRGVRRLPLVPAAGGAGPRGRDRHVRGAVLRPRPRRHGAGRLRPVRAGRGPQPGVRPGAHVRARRRDRRGRRPAARQRDHAGRRPGQARGQHVHGVGPGGAGALPRPRPGRAGRRVPAGAEAGRGRQGRAQGDRPADHPAGGHRPPEGLLPGAGHHPPRGQGARPGPRRAARGRRASAACSARSTSRSCSPTPTASSPRCRATSSGSSGCSSSGCRPTGSDR